MRVYLRWFQKKKKKDESVSVGTLVKLCEHLGDETQAHTFQKAVSKYIHGVKHKVNCSET